MPALRDVNRIDPAGGGLLHLPVGPVEQKRSVGCFPQRGGFFVVVEPSGDGTVSVLGGPGPLTNAALGHDDDALLAVGLLGAGPGWSVVLAGPAPGTTGGVGSGRRDLVSLVSRRVKLALLQLAIAFVVVVLWRSRRLGRVASEPQPVQIEASELVAAVGNLLHQGRRRDEAARLLRADLARRLTARLGLPGRPSADRLADAVAERTGLDPALVLRALEPGPVPHDDALVALARAADEIEAELARAGEVAHAG